MRELLTLITTIAVIIKRVFIIPALLYWGRRLTLTYLPEMIDTLDSFMPHMIINLSSEEVERKIFEVALSLGASEKEAAYLVKEYDRQFSPIKTADKCKQQHLEGVDE